jgi:hypothetical protein
MLPRTTLSAILLSAGMVTVFSCGVTNQGDLLEYNYNLGAKHYRLVMSVPLGYTNETHQRDDQGNLIRTFHYEDGAEFYIACKDEGLDPVISIEPTRENTQELANAIGEPGSGINLNGTHWSRQKRDGFIIGYDYVASKRLENFDKSLHSVRVKK